MLHLSNGRIRSKAVVFDENTETLPYQITHSNRRYYGSDLTGAARMFMYRITQTIKHFGKALPMHRKMK
jgi:hypothetical protein